MPDLAEVQIDVGVRLDRLQSDLQRAEGMVKASANKIQNATTYTTGSAAITDLTKNVETSTRSHKQMEQAVQQLGRAFGVNLPNLKAFGSGALALGAGLFVAHQALSAYTAGLSSYSRSLDRISAGEETYEQLILNRRNAMIRTIPIVGEWIATQNEIDEKLSKGGGWYGNAFERANYLTSRFNAQFKVDTALLSAYSQNLNASLAADSAQQPSGFAQQQAKLYAAYVSSDHQIAEQKIAANKEIADLNSERLNKEIAFYNKYKAALENQSKFITYPGEHFTPGKNIQGLEPGDIKEYLAPNLAPQHTPIVDEFKLEMADILARIATVREREKLYSAGGIPDFVKATYEAEKAEAERANQISISNDAMNASIKLAQARAQATASGLQAEYKGRQANISLLNAEIQAEQTRKDIEMEATKERLRSQGLTRKDPAYREALSAVNIGSVARLQDLNNRIRIEKESLALQERQAQAQAKIAEAARDGRTEDQIKLSIAEKYDEAIKRAETNTIKTALIKQRDAEQERVLGDYKTAKDELYGSQAIDIQQRIAALRGDDLSATLIGIEKRTQMEAEFFRRKKDEIAAVQREELGYLQKQQALKDYSAGEASVVRGLGSLKYQTRSGLDTARIEKILQNNHNLMRDRLGGAVWAD